MASVVTIRGGKNPLRAIDFVDHSDDKKRKRIRLGPVSLRWAREARGWIERLQAAKRTGRPDMPALEWASGLADDLHERIARQGLLQPRQAVQSSRLGEFISKYITQKSELAPSSIERLQDTRSRLVDYFGADTPIGSITADSAHDWRAAMRAESSEATTRLHCRNAKSMFKAAVTRGLIPVSPMADLVSAAIANDAEGRVTREEASRIIGECPNNQWRLLFVLCRFAGLRCPSETHSLEWSDILWDKHRMAVPDQKRKRTRVIPIFPEVLPYLEKAFEEAADGETRVITLSKYNRHRNLQKIVQRAGIEPWEDLFQALRRAAETDLAQCYPQYVVSRWVGHSIKVSEKHYLQIPDELYETASRGAAESAAVDCGNGSQAVEGSEGLPLSDARKSCRNPAGGSNLSQMGEARPRGLEPPTTGSTGESSRVHLQTVFDS